MTNKLRPISPRLIAGFVAALVLGMAAWCGAQDTPSLTLKQAVSLSLRNSRDLALARAQYSVAEDRARVLRSEFRPNLYTGSGLAYSHGFPQLPGGPPPDLFGFSYSQALLDEPLRGQLHAAEDRANNQKVELDRARDSVILRTASSYLELAKTRHSLELLRNERTSAQRIIDVTNERVTSGRELPIEITRGELTLAKVEQRVVQLEGRERILTDELQNLTGVSPDQLATVSAEDLPATPGPPARQQFVQAATERNVAVVEAEDEEAARRHILRGERGGYFPIINLLGQYSFLSKLNNYQLFYNHFQRSNFNIGVLVQIPLFGSRTRASIALARSQLAESQLSLGTARNDAQIAAEQKLETLREQDATREVARLDLKLAQESVAVSQTQFDEGRLTLKDLERAHLDESEKWMAFLDADFSRQQAELDVMATTGQLEQAFR